MDIQTIDKDLLNELLQRALNSERHRYAYDMRNSPADISQRILNTLLPDTVVPIHRHEDTNETTICLCGNLHVVFFEEREGTFKEIATKMPLHTRMVYQRRFLRSACVCWQGRRSAIMMSSTLSRQ